MADPDGTDTLAGQFLIAMPGMEDERFERSVIYVCAHSTDGAMGLIINQPAEQITFPDLLVQLDIIGESEQIELPAMAQSLRVHRGGPVETGRGFVLHTSDYSTNHSTLHIQDDICLTATLDILKAIADGSGPASALLALGYSGWGPGQLETEMQANGWLNAKCDPEVVFHCGVENRYQRALELLGIDPVMLSADVGHA